MANYTPGKIVPGALILFALFGFKSGKGNNPGLSLASTATPTPVASPTPYPIPRFDLASYLPVERGPVIHVSVPRGNDLGAAINKADLALSRGTISIEGGGSIKTQVTLHHHTIFDSATYSCDVPRITDFGQILVADGVLVEGTWRPPPALLDYFKRGNGHNPDDPFLLAVQALTKEQLAGTGTTILEPTYSDTHPAIEVFQSLGDTTASHTGKSHNISIRGFHLVGRQQKYDGGVRSSIILGNCAHCAAIENFLEDTGSIGIIFGGSGLNTGNFADDDLAYHNVTSGVAAANIAAVNNERTLVLENYVRRPGHHAPVFGGGVCGFDQETNSPADHSGGFVLNNLFDYEGAAFDGIGSAICMQDPYHGVAHHPMVAANNIVIGGRNDRIHRWMSNGIFLNGLKQCLVVNNYVYRTGQNAIQAYGLDACTIQDNDLDSTGGGGNPSIWLSGVENSILRRNIWRARAGLSISFDARMLDKCGSANVYESNSIRNSEGTLLLNSPVASPCK